MTRTRWATWRGILSATLKGSGSSSSSAVSARADGDGVNREKRLGDDTTCGLTGTERRSAGTERKAVTTARPQSSEAKALPLLKPVPRSQAYQVCSSVRASDWEVSRHFQRKKGNFIRFGRRKIDPSLTPLQSCTVKKTKAAWPACSCAVGMSVLGVFDVGFMVGAVLFSQFLSIVLRFVMGFDEISTAPPPFSKA